MNGHLAMLAERGSYGATSCHLSRLGVIVIFLVVIYGISTCAAGSTSYTNEETKWKLIGYRVAQEITQPRAISLLLVMDHANGKSI